MNQINHVYKVLSLLLSYPTPELQQEATAIKTALQADLQANAEHVTLLSDLLDDISGQDIYAAQERYVDLFDRSNARSLHLFEHVHGESRDRGQAMVDLLKMYEDKGYEVGASELPDYIPLFLEFLSSQPTEEAKALLQRILHIVTALHQRLSSRESIYANAFNVLEALAETQADQQLVNDMLNFPDDDPHDLEALDKIWEETAVSFGASDASNAKGNGSACSEEQLRTQLRAVKRSAA